VGIPAGQTTIDMPLALALSLVVLAGWGALLVSRGVLRRVAVALALAAALGVVASVARAPFVLPDDLRRNVGPVAAGVGTDPTGWYVTAGVAAMLSAVALGAAWWLVPRWPTMSSRYDAPATRATAADASTADQKDLWKALDEGHDPTDTSGPSSP
jgi:DNA-binding transcriptional LysR family regulator